MRVSRGAWLAAIGILIAGAPSVWAQAQAQAPAQARPQAPASTPADPHAGHEMEQPTTAAQDNRDSHGGHTFVPSSPDARGGPVELPPFIPTPTDADRLAAFPDVNGHAAHDRRLNYFILLEQAEWHYRDGQGILVVDSTGWVGRDRDRLWFRAGGEGVNGGVGDASVQALYGRQVARWWDIVAGVRQDVRPGPAQSWAALGVQGLAPYWFEVEATAYVSTSGQVQAQFHAAYDLRVTNRWIVQPLADLRLSATSDLERHVDSGLQRTELGVRLRYLVRREFAPYLGVTWPRLYGHGASHAVLRGEPGPGARLVAGARLWF